MTEPNGTEFAAFDSLVRSVLAVSHEEMKRREAEYRKASEARLFRPGPKRGSKRPIKASASPASGASRAKG